MGEKRPIDEFTAASHKLDKNIDKFDKSLEKFHDFCRDVIGDHDHQLDSFQHITKALGRKKKNGST